jgi:predicted ABC-type transport system involved in lysophospholipase L1 biosynthesis ATPase subunit
VSALGAALVVSTHDPEIAGRLDLEWAMSDGQLREPTAQGEPR